MIVGCLALACLFGCAMPQQSSPPPPTEIPRFSFKPPSEAAARSKIVIAVIKPQTKGSLFTGNTVAGGQDMARVQMLTRQMLESAETNVRAMIVAKGFNTLGPYESFDEMTYSDKKGASFVFIPIFNAAVDFQGSAWAANGATMAAQSGTVVVVGDVDMELREPMTKELLWQKHIRLEPSSAPYMLQVRTRQPDMGSAIVDAAMGVNAQPQDTRGQAVTVALNHFYSAAMSKMWDHLDPAGYRTSAVKLRN